MAKERPKKKSNIKAATSEEKAVEVKGTLSVKPLADNFTVYVPIATVSEANTFEHWTDKHRRHKKQKERTHLMLPAQKYPLPCSINLTRISPRNLDGDNLVSSMKHIRDAVAEKIHPGLAPGRADDDPLITWNYSQEKGQPKQQGVRISFIWS